MRPGKLALVLVGTSAGAEDTVVLDLMRTHKRSRNTCDAKEVPPRSTYDLGLDPAMGVLHESSAHERLVSLYIYYSPPTHVVSRYRARTEGL